jgi:hypothetical protein
MKIPSDAVRDVMTLRQKEIPILTCMLPQAELLFYSENPRIYSSAWLSEDDEPTQERIFQILSKSEHVRETLVPSIRNNGGLIEPILVRKGVVLEGNSRLAAYRLLAQKEPTRWTLIRAKVLPDTVADSEVFSLLGEYHMIGKKDWAPYEQAGYVYRRSKHHNIEDQELAREVGLTKKKVQHLIAVYSFMVRVEDRSSERWSYYDELLKGRRFDEARKLYPNFNDVIASKIVSGEIERAVDLRDDLPQITKVGGNTLKKFMNASFSFSEASLDARLRGAGNYHAKKLREFRTWLADNTIEPEIQAMSSDDLKNIEFELNKIQARSRQLVDRITKLRKH